MADSEEKNYSRKKINMFIIANAIVWGAVMILTSLVLRGTDYMDNLIPILGGGAGLSVVILSALLLRKE